ncbi:MAG: protein kinase [Chloroflexota bacterium]
MAIVTQKIGDYEVGEQIGRGAVAVVYRARHIRTGQEAALKMLLPQHLNKVSYLNRFVKEGQNAAKLVHPNLVRIYEAGKADGHPYIALELIHGDTLSNKLNHQGKLLTTAQIIPIVQQIAEGLEYAHNLGFVHRDINLNNILITDKNRAVVADFGMARQLVSDETTTVFTMADYSVGTPSFMSPEQARGDTDIDQRADVYSLGVIAYRMFTGRLPFQADSQTALLYKIIYEPAPAPEVINPSIPPGIAYALNRVLSKDPPKRYRSAIAFSDALEEGQSWIPQTRNRGYSRGLRNSHTTPQPTEGVTERRSQPVIATSNRASKALGWAVLPTMLSLVISALIVIIVLTINPPRSPEPPTTENQPSSENSLVQPLTAIVLKPYSPSNGQYMINVPDGWKVSSSASLTNFDAVDYFARIFVQQITANEAGNLLETLIDQYVEEGNTVFQSLRPLAGTYVQIGSVNGYEQQYRAVFLGQDVFVRLVAVNEDGQNYVIGAAIETERQEALNASFDAVFSSFRVTGG